LTKKVFSKMFPSLVIDFYLIMPISSIIGVIGVNVAPARSADPPPPSADDCRRARPDSPNPYAAQCGRYNVSRTISRRRIFGGQDATRGAFPWQADMRGSNMKRCGGTVVDELHVITAAHCLQDDIGLVGDLLYFGHVYSLEEGKDECTRQTRRVEKVQVHPCYCGDRKCGNELQFDELQFDIAILTLDAPLNFNEFVQPICLPDHNTEPPEGLLATVSGFGSLDFDTKEKPTSLQFVSKPIVSLETCKNKYYLAQKKIVQIQISNHGRHDVRRIRQRGEGRLPR